MPPPKVLISTFLILLMELLAAFALLIGSNFLSVTTLQYGLFPLLLTAGLTGIILTMLIATSESQGFLGRLVMMAGTILIPLLPAYFLVHSFSARAGLALLLLASYRRGLSLGEDSPDYGDVQHSFSLGFALLLVSIIWMIARGLVSPTPTWAALAIVAVLYVVVALISLASARMDTARASGAGQTVAFSIGVPVAFLLVASLAAIEVFSLDLSGSLGRLIQPFFNLVGPVLLGLLRFVLTPVLDLADYFHFRGRPIRAKIRHLPFPLPKHHAAHAHHPADTIWLKTLGISITALVAIGLLLLIWHTLPELRRRQLRKRKKERGRLWAPRAFWPAFLSWARRLLQGGAELVVQGVAVAKRRTLGPVYPEHPVRRVYAQLLFRASKRGLPRPKGATPAEFLTQLLTTWPEGSQHFIALTNAYILCRYGEAPFQEQEVHRLKEHWRAAKASMRTSNDGQDNWLSNPLGAQ